MKISFLSLALATDAIGPRILSSSLKQNGFETQLIFLPTVDDIMRRATKKAFFYDENILNQLVDICKNSDMIGISLMTHHYSTARDLTIRLKNKLDTTVIWGGIHPTVRPEQSLETADFICAGEGETAIVELAQKMEQKGNLSNIKGIWLKSNDEIIDNGYGCLASNLDELPFPDYSFDDHYLLVKDQILSMTKEIWHQHQLSFFPPLNRTNPDRPAYQVLSARGCPFKCSFCGEGPLSDKTIYGHKYLRKRSIDNLLDELVLVKDTFPFVGEICFCDDTFPSRSLRELQDFSDKYKEKIGLPFYVLVSPANVTKAKFDLLVDAGLTNVGMGIQSGSEKIIKLYNREKVGSVEQSLFAAKVINEYKDRLMPFYDFIVENPYETKRDLIDTIRLISKLPHPYEIRVYALSFFPGTDLYVKSYNDGILHEDRFDKTFGQRSEGGYLSFIIDLTKYKFFRYMLILLISKPFVTFFCRPIFDRAFMRFQTFIKWIAIKLKLRNWGLS